MNGKTKITLGGIAATVVTVAITIGTTEVLGKKWWIWSWEADTAHMLLAGEIKKASEIAYENKLKILYDRYDGNLVRKDACTAIKKDCTGIIQRIRDLEQEIKRTEKSMENLQK